MEKIATCPKCGVETKLGRPMQDHLQNSHGITGMDAHIVANPNDQQAKRSKTGRKKASKPKRILTAQKSNDSDVIDDSDMADREVA